jgi:hypothetical protein
MRVRGSTGLESGAQPQSGAQPNAPRPHPPQDPRQRLGARAGAAEVKQHPWFAGVNWALGRADQDRAAEMAAAGAPQRAPLAKAAAKSSRGGRAAAPSAAINRQLSALPEQRRGGGKAAIGCFMFGRSRSRQ